MPYHGLIVWFELKKFARLEISISVINTIIAGGNTNFVTAGGREFSSNFAFVRIFHKFSRLRITLFKLITWLGLNVLVKIIFSKSLFLSNFG